MDATKIVTAYNQAVKTGKSSFTLDGTEFLTNYAYYVIQHMADNLKVIRGKFNTDKTFKLCKNNAA